MLLNPFEDMKLRKLVNLMKTLVVYYSLSGNTRFVAEKIAEQLDADLCEVTDKKHRKGKLLYIKGGYAALRQKLTDIEVSKSIKDYDFIIVGSPVWAGRITPAIRTFLVEDDFSDKQVAYFVTLGGNKAEKTLKNIKTSVPPKTAFSELVISKALENKEDVKEQVIEWCSQLPK